MISKIINFLIIILFFSLAIVNSHLLYFLGIENLAPKIYISGNYEFFKVLFFNIISGFILIIFFIKNIIKNDSILFPKMIFYIILLLTVSNIFSQTPFTSFFGNNEKGHSTLMFINLLGILLVILKQIKEDKKLKTRIWNSLVLSVLVVSFFGTKEFFDPSMSYGELGNRAISSLGHPNYLSGFIILFIPFLYNKIEQRKNKQRKIIYINISIIILFTLLLTKSIWAIFLFLIYIFYKKSKKIGKIFTIFLLITGISLGIFFTIKYYPEKISSFISRFYIWKSTVNIISSNIYNFIFGNGLGNLGLIFEGFKIKQLYIFENYGFIADRPHNLFLYIFYSFGLIGTSLFIYLIKNLLNIIKEKNTYIENKLTIETIILFLLFNIFNFSSIVNYTFIVFIISLIIKNNKLTKNIFIKIFFIIISLTSIIFYSQYFLEENKKYLNQGYELQNKIIKKINSEDKEKEIFIQNQENLEIMCIKLIENSKSAENYLYCGNILYKEDKDLAKSYYELGLKKLPDLWNNNSNYYNNILINRKNLKHRFFSEKYSNIKEILTRMGIKLE